MNFIGNIVPDVFIKKITIENGTKNVFNNSRGIDPHIDIPSPDELPPDLKDRFVNVFEGLEISPEVISNSLSELNEIRNNSVNFEPESLIIKVCLAIRDEIKPGLLSKWVDNESFTKFLTLRVIQSTNSVISDAFFNKKIEINSPQVNNLIGMGLSYEDIPLSVTNIDSYLVNVLDDGSKEYEILFTSVFELDNQPEHLSYFAQTSVDFQSFADSFEPPLTDISPLMSLKGEIASQSVFINKKTVTSAVIYVDSVGEVWTGPTIVWDDGRRIKGTTIPNLTEEQLTNGLFFLEERDVSNPKIQDFRYFKKIKSFEFDLDSLKNEIIGEIYKNSVFKKPEVALFTELYSTIDDQNSIRLCFGINKNQLIEKSSPYGNLYKNLPEQLKPRILDKSLVKLIRQRVNSLGKIYENEDSVVIADGYGSSTVTGNINILELGFDHFFIHALDKDITTKNAGEYKYTFVIEIVDELPKITSGFIEELSVIYDKLNTFLKVATSPANYFLESDTYHPEFIESAISNYENNIVPIISRYFEILKTFVGELEDFPEIVTAFNVLLNPKTGTPRGFYALLELVEELVSKLEKISPNKQLNNQGTNINNRPYVKFSHTFKEVIKRENKSNFGFDFLFENESNSDISTFGLSIIPFEIFEQRATQEISKYFENEETNVSIESEGINFNPNDSAAAKKYSYFTPAKIKTESLNSFKQVSQQPSNESYNQLLAEILDFTEPNVFSFQENFTAPTETLEKKDSLKLGNKLETILSSNGVTIERNFVDNNVVLEPGGITYADKETLNNDSIEFSNLINDTLLSLIGYKFFDLEFKSTDKLNLSTELGKDTFIKLAAATAIQGLLGIKADPVRDLPNQLKQLIMQYNSIGVGLNSIVDLKADNIKLGYKFFKLYMNYLNVVGIEYLSGFEENDIQRPIWSILTGDVIQQGRDNNLIFLCRMKKYENKVFDIKEIERLKIPIYNEFFVLKNPTTTASLEIEEDATFEQLVTTMNQELTNYNLTDFTQNSI